MKKLGSLVALVLMLVLPLTAHASVYTPRNHEWAKVHQVAHKTVTPVKTCPHAIHARVSDITQQGQLTLGCEQGYRAYVMGVIKFAGIGGTVNGYFKFHVINVHSGFSYWVTQGNFSVPSQQCVLACYFQSTYTPQSDFYVEDVSFWADHTGSIAAAQCEQP